MLRTVKQSLSQPARVLFRKSSHFIKAVRRRSRKRASNMSNIEENRDLWNRYSKRWNKSEVPVDEDLDVSQQDEERYIEYLGDEWGRRSDVEEIVSDYILRFINEESVVAEIGIGGARIASRVVGETKEFYGFDISSEMLVMAKDVLANYSHVKYVLLSEPQFADEFVEKFDFVYSFDVFVHLDLHTMWKYFVELRRILKPGGKAFIHTTNLKAGGWKRFSRQKAYSVAGHYFISPEIVDILAQHSDLRIIKSSTMDPANFYLNRDYLVVLEKPSVNDGAPAQSQF